MTVSDFSHQQDIFGPSHHDGTGEISKVSVIIPNFNNSNYIAKAVQSVIDQTYSPYEIVVVDDGSTDDSREVIGSFGNQVRYIWQENQGLGGARNTGIFAAGGDFVGLLDADDQWQPDYLERMVALMNQHPEAAVYYCQAQGMDSDGHHLPQFFGGPPIPADQMYPTLLRANFLIPSTILMRRSIVLNAGLFDQQLRSCEDWDLWLRILPEIHFVGISDNLVRYRLHAKTLSADPAYMQNAARKVIEKHFGTDDGQYGNWSWEKRRAYGGTYRYITITSIQRQNDWDAAGNALRRALQTDPSLASDIDFFYELALGAQPAGYRGTAHQLNLVENSVFMMKMLEEVFRSQVGQNMNRLRGKTCGSAYFALGLIAYNTGQFSIGRAFFLKALKFSPELLYNRLLIGDLIKSSLGPTWVKKLRQYRHRGLPDESPVHY
jgi:glycosyltransferase involved in cell wall biosynthesis